ncbi:uncharacterized protein LOC125648232 [Ostrea edulis]|uniref:uncharacterized protein LOC125648232 n=1 Tax=Ostrea edulis TaxID=37623 RepID=UPI0024AF98AE|nr:uncharacterized protein LOC125648232 [Ostrea edulis]
MKIICAILAPCVVYFIFVIFFESERDQITETRTDQSTMIFSRRKRQSPRNNYTLEILFVVDPVVLNWFKSQIGPGTEEQILEQTINVTRLHYLRVFNGIKIRFMNSPEIDVKLELVDITFTKNLSFPLPISYTPDSRSLIPAPGVLDAFRDWINTTELPDHDHALFFTGYNLTYGGSASSTGLSYPESVCTGQAVSVVEEFYDERTAVYAAQELGRSLGSRLDMDGNFCRSTNLNIMSTKFVFNSPKTSNLWKFSRCSIVYIKAFLRKLDSDGKDCVRTLKTDVIQTQVPPTPDPDTQCRTALGLDSFLCRAVTGTDYSALCGGMSCFVPKSTTCSDILPLDGTVCGNYSVCQEGQCVESSDGRNVPESCPFGDQPVLPDSVGCSDRIYGRPFDCYLPSFNAACCQSCEEIKTDIGDCEYGDRIDRCQYSKCSTYNNFTRENLCCLTCKNGKSPYSASTDAPLSTTSSDSVFYVTSDDAKSTQNGTSLIRTTTPVPPSTTESTSTTRSSTKTVPATTEPTTQSDYDTTSESSPAVTTAFVSKTTSPFTTDQTTSTFDVSFTPVDTTSSSSTDSTLTSSADSTSTLTLSTEKLSSLTSSADSTYTLTSSTKKSSTLASSTDSSSSLSSSRDITSTLTSSADSTYILTSSTDSSLTSLTEESSTLSAGTTGTLSSTAYTMTSSADKSLLSTKTDVVLSSTSTKTTMSESTRTTTSLYTSRRSSSIVESTTFPTSSDVTTSTPITTPSSGGSSEVDSCGESSSADSSEKKRKKIWEKKLKEQEKERKRREKRMKDLKKKYEKLLKQLRKYLVSLHFQRLWSYYYFPNYRKS